MTITELLAFLKQKEIRIKLSGTSELDIKAPKGVVTREIVDLIRSRKAELIAYFQDFQLQNVEIKRVEESRQFYPLSYAQKKLWILSQVPERSIAYTVADLLRIEQPINLELLEDAIISTLLRHEMLRTLFTTNDKGEPQQYVIPAEEFEYKLDMKDLSDHPDPNSVIQTYTEKDVAIPFDLSKGPLLRTCAFKISEEQYALYYAKHHIITDGVSMDLMMRDVMEFYRASMMQQEPSLPELNIQYKDYVLWQMDHLEKPESKADRAFWMEKLSGDLTPLDLPNQKPRPQVLTYNGCTLSSYIAEEDTQKLKAFCNEQGGTLFMGILAVWNVLFHKLTQSNDIIIGSPIAGREQAVLENQIGVYMNMLILRNRIDPNKSFKEIFGEIKNNTLESTKHQAYPVDRLMDDLQLVFDPSRNPIYDVMLSYHNTGENTLNGVRLTQETIDTIKFEDNERSKLDMLINVKEHGTYMFFNINFNTDVYEESTIRTLMKDFKNALKGLMKDWDTPITHLDFATQVKNDLRQRNKTRFKMKVK
ncbi:condensation domain-containing protein [Aureisphaera galaxeae]|uniref:condensation domain-containing protein n=1 Tax=Aureisphaera galaxeae TaxID=1538023 RepID=UPI0023509BD8|nr:condensation domain-containing protein [Aureisphaera galaxeae]MDC8004725.1 condensation domain-containing protein [Aureisphaera galaxeae]